MSSRCKFCGYRFKSDDEAICPECLTAREVDISCNTFAPEEHTHRRYDDSLFKGDELFSKNDTFKEEENEFLKEEREEESETNAARFEKMEQKQRSFQNRNTNMGRTFTNAGFQPNNNPMNTGGGNYIPRNSDSPFVNGRFNTNTNSAQNSDRYVVFNGSGRLNGADRPSTQMSPTARKGCITAIVLFMIFSSLLTVLPVIFASKYSDNSDPGREIPQNNTAQTEQDTDNGNEEGVITDEDERYNSATRIFSVDRKDLNARIDDEIPESLSEDEKYRLLLTDDNGQLTMYSDDFEGDPEIYRITSEITVSADREWQGKIKITGISCYAYDDQYNTVSVDLCDDIDSFVTDPDGDGEIIKLEPILYSTADCEYFEIVVTVDYGEGSESAYFRTEVNNS